MSSPFYERHGLNCEEYEGQSPGVGLQRQDKDHGRERTQRERDLVLKALPERGSFALKSELDDPEDSEQRDDYDVRDLYVPVYSRKSDQRDLQQRPGSPLREERDEKEHDHRAVEEAEYEIARALLLFAALLLRYRQQGFAREQPVERYAEVLRYSLEGVDIGKSPARLPF